MLLAVSAAVSAQSPRYNVGTPLSQADIDSFDHTMIGPEGQSLPVGHGTSKEGTEIFAKRCEICHGKDGQENATLFPLVSGSPGKPYRGDFFGAAMGTISYFPFAPMVWASIYRSMPASNPGSLKPDEVYALVAFLLYRSGIINENAEMNQKTLPKVVMPNRDGFVPAKPVYPENMPSWF